ncbi:MAG: CPBP family intramembrane metalloprotease [Eubacteriales bacterium]|nr:CPBP family intramembrane metalloprotease [Eubacteriales bacterium]
MVGKIRKWMQSHPVVVGLAGLAIGYAGIKYVPEPNKVAEILNRAMLSVIMLAIMAAVGGREAFRWEKGSFVRSARLYRSMLVVAVVLGVAIFASNAWLAGGVPVAGWGGRLALLVVEYFFVGLFEETCFRGVLMGGLVTKWGNTRKGLWGAMVISGLVFGFVHVASALFGVMTAATALQMFSKTFTTAFMGILIGAVYLETRNIWAVSILHGFSDLVLMIGSGVYAAEGITLTYVNAEQGVADSVFGLVGASLIHLWPLIAGIKLTKKLPLPQKGAWKDA